MDLHSRADRIAHLLEEQLDIRGQGLGAKLGRAGRRLPRWVRREFDALQDALDYAEHPKLQQRIDYGRLETGLHKAEAWLEAVDPWDRRKGLVLGWLGGNAVNLLLVAALAIGVMVWRGLL